MTHMLPYKRVTFVKIFWDYNDVFFRKDAGDKLENTVVKTEFEIVTKPCLPQAKKIYRIPEAHRTEVEKQMNELLKQNIIRPSTSPWNAPVYVVSKKSDADGIRKWRVVIDYRSLNKQMLDDEYPIPRIEDIFDHLSHTTSFTTLDLTSGFHQIPIKPADQEKTTFSTHFGHYHFT